MKKIVSMILIWVAILFCFVGCGSKVDKADDYIKKANKSNLMSCAYSAEYKEDVSYHGNVYEVSVIIPCDSDESKMVVMMKTAEVAKNIYPELESILKNDKSVDRIMIFFYYLDGYMYDGVYMDGEWTWLD